MGTKSERFEAIVRKLLSKTVERGATEDEAMAAAQKARELIDRYQLEVGAEEIVKEGLERYDVELSDQYHIAFATFAYFGLEKYCDVETWSSKTGGWHGRGRKFTVVGLSSDVELFKHLALSLWQFGYQELSKFITYHADLSINLRKQKYDFVKAFGGRISDRAHKMHRERMEAARQATQTPSFGRALVPINKNAMIETWKTQHGIRLGTRSVKAHRLGSASDHGSAAGDKASFGRPLSGNTKLLGR